MEGKEILDNIIVGRVEPYIYAFSTNTIPNYLKIGDTYRPVSTRLNEWKKYFPDLQEKYKEKAMIDKNTFFRDYAVHKYIEENLGKERLKVEDLYNEIYYSNEFFKNTTSNDVKEAIKNIKESHEKNEGKYQFYDATTSLPEILIFKREEKEWQPRPNQAEAIDNFIKARKSGRKNLLMYAVMRFGKSFTSMMCAKEMNAKLVVIVSAKADVKLEWKRTVETPKNFEEYSFISSENLERNNKEITERLSKGEKVAVFLTLQDLQGELIKEKHKDIFKNKIDLLIVDETHFGARAEKYGKILENTKYQKDVKDKHEKEDSDINELNDSIKVLDVDTTLHLSGTPYRILMGSEFEKEDIISFCQFSNIVEEQEKWNKENILNDETKEWDNPYYGFPQMIRFAFNPSKSAKEKLEEYKKNGYTYNFSALLKPKSISKSDDESHKKFENEQEVLELFEAIDGSKKDENVLGFLNYEKIKEGKMCRHIVCVLPYCASCDALEQLIKSNKNKFKNLGDYEIINISGVDNTKEYKSIEKIKDKIKDCEDNDKKTITLTVNRMLTGSTVEQWDAMIYLKDTSSPQEYDQAIFRLQNQYVKEYIGDNGNVIKYNMKPQTLLVDFDPYRMFSLQEQKSKIYNVNIEEAGNSLLEERLKNELRVSPIIAINKNKIVKIEPKNIMEAVSEYSKNKGVMDEVNDIPVDLRILENDEIRNVIDKQAELGSNKGLSMDNTNDEDGEDLDISIPDTEDSNKLNNQIDDRNKNEDNNNEPISYDKKIRTYFARVLFYSFLTKDDVDSLLKIIDSIENNEDNRRIAKNLELDINVLRLMNNNMDAFKLSQLDYKIQNINKLSKDTTITSIERAIIATNKFKKLSQSEIITPSNVCEEMIKTISNEKMINICEKGGKILDIASKMGEFSLALYKILIDLNIEKEQIYDIMFSIPTSSVAYEFTRKIYNILDLNIDNIATKFNTYNLLDVVDKTNDIDYEKIKKYLLKSKKFSTIDLKDDDLCLEGDERMNFDIIVGNPPYQENTSKNSNQGTAIYDKFVNMSINLNPELISMIIPSRWMTTKSIKSLSQFRTDFTIDNKIKKMTDYIRATDCFDDVNLSGGVCYFLYDNGYTGECDFTNVYNGVKSTTKRNLNKYDIIPHFIQYEKILNKIDYSNNISSIVSSISPFGISTTDRGLEHKTNNTYILHTSKGERYYKKEDVKKGLEYIEKYKVLISQTVPGKAGEPDKNGQHPVFATTIKVIGPGEICSHSYILVGSFEKKEYANNLLSYLKTKFCRFLVYLSISSIHLTQATFSYVPMQDFSKKWTDTELYKKYELTNDEISFIESIIKKLD